MKKSCTIIISHYESLSFLRTCIRQIKKYTNPDISQSIIIADQSSEETHQKLLNEFKEESGISIFNMKPLYSGYGIDWLMRCASIETDYVCQLHVDAFPIHKNWLYMPISIMEKNDFKFTGVLQFICDKPETIYPYKGKGVFAMAQCFNIGKADIYREMSLEGGFTRFHNRPNNDVSMTWKNNDWADWAKEDYNARGSDDDVPAFFWEDNYREHDKMSFGFTGKIGIDGEESNYGTIIEDMVFHFGFHLESRGVMPQMGVKYGEWTRRINEDYSDSLIEEMLAQARKQPMDCVNGRKVWNGRVKKASQSSEELNNKIEQLKQK
jgi:hypothetical protein